MDIREVKELVGILLDTIEPAVKMAEPGPPPKGMKAIMVISSGKD
jgi:hypothetical protein